MNNELDVVAISETRCYDDSIMNNQTIFLFIKFEKLVIRVER